MADKKIKSLPVLKISPFKTKEESKGKSEENDIKNETHDKDIAEVAEETDSVTKEKEEQFNKKDNSDRNISLKSRSSNVSHNKSSFPNVLDQYGKNEKKAKFDKKRSKTKRKGKKTSVFYDSEEEKELEKERDDEKYLRVLEDLKKLRKYYYNEYKELMTEKVEQQRRRIKRQKEKLEIELRKKEKMQREASHRVRRRSDHHILSHDEDFLKDIPKSDVFLIIGLQDKLIKEGKLKSQTDFDNFWLEMKKPDVFYSYFPEKVDKSDDSSDGGISSVSFGNVPPKPTSTSTKTATTPSMLPRTLSNIDETKELSRPSTQEETWAVTQKYKFVHSAGHSSGKPSKLSKQAASDLELKCPKLEMPPLHCFQMDLGKPKDDPEEVRQKAELKLKEKHRRGFLKKLHKMHHLAMANRAAATRILDQHKYLTFLIQGPELTDIISDYYWGFSTSPAELGSSETQEELSSTMRLPQIGDQRAHSAPEHITDSSAVTQKLTVSAQDIRNRIIAKTNQIAELRGYSSPEPKDLAIEENVSTQSRGQSGGLDSDKQLVPYTPVKPLPLSVNDITDKSKIMEAKCLSTVWVNYLRAGKPLSLTS